MVKAMKYRQSRELLRELNIKGCMIATDALNCQKETAEAAVSGGADYLLCVKDNQPSLKTEIEEYVQDEDLRKNMDKTVRTEKNRERNEKRTAYTTDIIDWLDNKEKWTGLECIGAVHTKSESKKGITSEWHYYISSRKLTSEEILYYARNEWSVESMHYILDVDFEEDFCRVEDKNVQQNLNMFRKLALNIIKQYKTETNSKKAVSKIVFDCLLDCSNLLKVIPEN